MIAKCKQCSEKFDATIYHLVDRCGKEKEVLEQLLKQDVK